MPKHTCQWTQNDKICTKYAHGDGQGGKKIFCITHGGGARCQEKECQLLPQPRSANHVLDGVNMCWQHYYNQINKTCRAIRREPLFLGALICHLPKMLGLTHEEFDNYYMNHDKNIKSCQLLRRPDLLFCFPFFAVLFEFDENNGHRDRTEENEIRHLDVIRRYVLETHNLQHMYILRINPEGKHPLFKKILASNKEPVWKPTEYFPIKFQEIAKKSKSWIEKAIRGPVPQELKNGFLGTLVEKMYYPK